MPDPLQWGLHDKVLDMLRVDETYEGWARKGRWEVAHAFDKARYDLEKEIVNCVKAWAKVDPAALAPLARKEAPPQFEPMSFHLLHTLKDKVREMDECQAIKELREKEGLWENVQSIGRTQYHLEKSIVKYVTRWVRGTMGEDYTPKPEPKAEVEEEGVATPASVFEPLYEKALRERDLWRARCDDLLDLVLCEYCEDEKNRVYQRGTPEEVLCWKPCNCSWPCNRVRSIFKDETIKDLIPRCVVVVVYAC